jgi:hypothetical protein
MKSLIIKVHPKSITIAKDSVQNVILTIHVRRKDLAAHIMYDEETEGSPRMNFLYQHLEGLVDSDNTRLWVALWDALAKLDA